MTNKELEDLYRYNSDVSHLAALRGIYSMGYAQGSGTTLTDTYVIDAITAPTTTTKIKVGKNGK